MTRAALDALALLEAPAVVLRLFRTGWNDTTEAHFLLDTCSVALILHSLSEHGVGLAMHFDHSAFALVGVKRDVPECVSALVYRAGEGPYATLVRWKDVG